MIWLPKYVVSCRLHCSLVLVVVALQMSQMPCWMNSSGGVLGRLWRVLQFGATVAVRSRIHPQGARTIPKMKMPGVRMDMRIHSCVDRLGMIAAALCCCWRPLTQTQCSTSDRSECVLTAAAALNKRVGLNQWAGLEPHLSAPQSQNRTGEAQPGWELFFFFFLFFLSSHCRDVQEGVSTELFLCKCVWEGIQKRQRSTFFFCHWAVSGFHVIKSYPLTLTRPNRPGFMCFSSV